MAVYTFKVIKKITSIPGLEEASIGDIVEVEIRMKEYDQYKIDHPELERYMEEAPGFNFEGRIKPPSGFMKHVLGRMQENTPGAKNMMDNRKWSIPREW